MDLKSIEEWIKNIKNNSTFEEKFEDEEDKVENDINSNQDEKAVLEIKAQYQKDILENQKEIMDMTEKIKMNREKVADIYKNAEEQISESEKKEKEVHELKQKVEDEIKLKIKLFSELNELNKTHENEIATIKKSFGDIKVIYEQKLVEMEKKVKESYDVFNKLKEALKNKNFKSKYQELEDNNEKNKSMNIQEKKKYLEITLKLKEEEINKLKLIDETKDKEFNKYQEMLGCCKELYENMAQEKKLALLENSRLIKDIEEIAQFLQKLTSTDKASDLDKEINENPNPKNDEVLKSENVPVKNVKENK